MLEESLGVLAQQLADRLCGQNETLCLALIRLLADGQAVPAQRLADVLSISLNETATQLQSLSDIEFDSAGNVLAFGLSHQPTTHQFTVNGHQLYTWCALDTFMYTALLGVSTQVRSTCPFTHFPISLAMNPQGIEHLDPLSAVVSLVVPSESIADCRRSAFCNHGHFFISEAAAAEWQSAQPNAVILDIPSVHRLGQRVAVCRVANAKQQLHKKNASNLISQ